MATEYRTYLIFTRSNEWQDWTLAAQSDTLESALLAADTQKLYLDTHADILIAKYLDVSDLINGTTIRDEVEVETWQPNQTPS